MPRGNELGHRGLSPKWSCALGLGHGLGGPGRGDRLLSDCLQSSAATGEPGLKSEGGDVQREPGWYEAEQEEDARSKRGSFKQKTL